MVLFHAGNLNALALHAAGHNLIAEEIDNPAPSFQAVPKDGSVQSTIRVDEQRGAKAEELTVCLRPYSLQIE